MAADVDDEQPGVLVIERKDVEKVSREAVARHIPPCHMRGRERHVGGWQQRLLHLGRRFEVANHLRVDAGDTIIELGELGIGSLQIVTGNREILVGDDQFLVLGYGILERRHEQIEHLLTAGLHAKPLAGQGHFQRGRRLGAALAAIERRRQQ